MSNGVIKGISWSSWIFITLSLAAFMIANINYYSLNNSPLIKGTILINNLNFSCREKFIGTIIIRGIWELIQVYFSNYILSNISLNCFKKKENEENLALYQC